MIWKNQQTANLTSYTLKPHQVKHILMGFLQFKTTMKIECYARVGLLPGSASKGVYFKIYDISSSEEAYPRYQTFLEELKNQHPNDFVTGMGWKITEIESN